LDAFPSLPACDSALGIEHQTFNETFNDFFNNRAESVHVAGYGG
jgi:hypothetical protein